MILLSGLLSLFLFQAPAADPRWTEEEAQKRAEEIFAPDELKHLEIFRSKYYIIFTDSGAGKNFAKIMDEQVYEGFRALFPFKDAENQRLMAVYLFKTKEGYFSFCERVPKWDRKKAEQSAGHAWKDYYATSYSSPRDSVHFHEGAHQIMSNRLKLWGGGSWFQEGVAEYYQDRIDKMNRASETRAAIKSKQNLSLRELFSSESLLFTGKENSKGYGGASGRYGQAASVIQFFKEGPLNDKWPDFFKKIGRAQRGNVEETEKILKEIFGLSIEQLEEKWKEFFVK